MEREARGFGANTDNEGCLKETFARYQRSNNIKGQYVVASFTQACLKASNPSPGFCDGLPAMKYKGTEETEESVNWKKAKCSGMGLPSNSGCKRIFGHVQTYCQK
jgi:hypothetical protein